MKYLESAIGKAEKVVRLDWRDERAAPLTKGLPAAAAGRRFARLGSAFSSEWARPIFCGSGRAARPRQWRAFQPLGVCSSFQGRDLGGTAHARTLRRVAFGREGPAFA